MITKGTLLIFLLSALTISAQDASSPDPSLPKDVNPDSRSRLPLIHRDDLDERGKKAFDAAAGRSGGAPQGAAAIRLHGSGTRVQFESPIGFAPIQLALLTTAREHDQPFEWSLHEMFALAVNVDPATIDIIKNRKPLAGLPERDAMIIQVGREVFSTHKVSPETYARALRALGKSNLVDAIGQMGGYASLSAMLTAFNQQMPPGWKQFLPLSFTLPTDIHPDSRSRLPIMRGVVLPLASLYQRTLSPEGTGPAILRLHGAGYKSLEASVGRRVIDLAILVTARGYDSQYDWTVNEIASAKDGLEPAVIDVVRNRKSTAGLAEKDASLIDFARELYGKHYVTAETYARVVKVFGERDLVDLSDVMGQNASDATLLNAFDQHLPAGQKPLLPLP